MIGASVFCWQGAWAEWRYLMDFTVRLGGVLVSAIRLQVGIDGVLLRDEGGNIAVEGPKELIFAQILSQSWILRLITSERYCGFAAQAGKIKPYMRNIA